ncbi:polyribonucleotide nucleotidyltransferase [Candidatus Nomurabacteria bacterium]|uniref:Polyribonucleotide nucleotidyltransferase n=1 Tax=Candidatus Dojkabacteria bacterium TaxID=2099670 RepID=A0A955I1F9_9BACT|nr:polyribonucleotide nucleotidyltransferase [Candidatus Dojkabacteria bacterium]MCB9789442.1 polyribonucleotide nucleotidyltransferase [Candidatus Nomurabacteria bacterium]MCB9803764.1 polyribonucleotide nucleotidyltransferase [Candidatus Nomurabacteria bacterium]
MFKEIKHEFEIEGVKCTFSTGKLARKSQSAVIAQMGDTVVMATVNTGEARTDMDYFPLSVEYIEKMYAAGKISGSRFVKRDRFPTDDATLKARIIDRSIRPRFPEDYRDEVQVIVKVLSFDPDYDPVIIGVNAVSAALLISGSPITEPISGVRVGMKDETLFAYNKHVDRDNIEESKLDLVLAGDGKSLTNIDSNAYEISEDRYIEAMEYGLELMTPWLEAQRVFADMVEGVEKAEYVSFALPEELVKKAVSIFGDEIGGNLTMLDKRAAKSLTLEKMAEEFGSEYSKKQLDDAYEAVAKKELRKLVLGEGKRVDGRALDEIRELNYEVDLLPRVHGSGLFTRGMTQVMTIATLGSSRSMMFVDDMTGEDTRRYMHFYVEGPYSFGEAGRYKYIPGRREVGHGALAEKALYPVLPSMEEFPYTIMLMSEIMSEEGSSSMASTCGSTLALMDAGVPIKKPVAGIAIGVVMDEDTNEFKVLTDIQGVEDFYGYMDFKVTGTRDGVTAVQMDTKSSGLPMEIFREAIQAAKKARLTILDGMAEVIGKPREELSEFAPKVEMLMIPVSKIGELIGPGGKNIKKIIDETGVELNVEDDGSVHIYADDAASIQKAREYVEEYAFEPEVGQIYTGTVSKIAEFGAFVKLAKSVEGLVHVSEISDSFVKDVRSFLKEGETVKVKVIGFGDNGKIRLSIKALSNGSSPDQSTNSSHDDSNNTEE